MERSKEDISAKLKTMVENGFPTKFQYNDEEWENELMPELEKAEHNNGKFISFFWMDNVSGDIDMFVFSSDDGGIGYFKNSAFSNESREYRMITKKEFSEIVLIRHDYTEDGDDPYVIPKDYFDFTVFKTQRNNGLWGIGMLDSVTSQDITIYGIEYYKFYLGSKNITLEELDSESYKKNEAELLGALKRDDNKYEYTGGKPGSTDP